MTEKPENPVPDCTAPVPNLEAKNINPDEMRTQDIRFVDYCKVGRRDVIVYNNGTKSGCGTCQFNNSVE